MMWSECKELWLEGPREYIVQLWNVLDFGMLSIFIAAFTARFLAFLQATKAQQYVDSHVQESDLSEVTLPPEVQYFTYGELLAVGPFLFPEGHLGKQRLLNGLSCTSSGCSKTPPPHTHTISSIKAGGKETAKLG